MKLYTFDESNGKQIKKFESDFIMSRIIQTDKAANIGCMHLAANGIVGYHQAVVPQLLLVVNGEGTVRGGQDEYVAVASGDAVFWQQGEWHETKSEHGMTAIVIESEELDTTMLTAKK